MLPQIRTWVIQVKCVTMSAIWQFTVQITHVYMMVPMCARSATFPSCLSAAGENMYMVTVKIATEERVAFNIQPKIRFQLKHMFLCPC